MYCTPQHHHHPSHHHRHHHHHHRGGGPVVPALSPESHAAAQIFEQLCNAYTFKSVLHHYRTLCQILKLKPTNFRNFYPKLKSKLQSWKAQALWSKFDKRSSHKCYGHGKACSNLRVLVIGAGPCGLRTAIEAQLLGAKVVLVEKRDRFSRNNVLHLWPFVINDLKQLGAKKFYGKFCAGAIDHISIRQLQCILLKVALLLGVEVFESTGFEEVVEPSEEGTTEKHGWRARLSPPDHPANQYEFDILIGADGKRNTLGGFKRKEFRGKLAIAITANFINKKSEAEARVQEISGVAFIFNQKFFKELYAATGIDLENIVYYKDETHYFVMTAKKHSLLDKGVILKDLADTQSLLHPNNVDRQALQEYAKEAADFSTNYQLPHTEFAINHYGKSDVAMFDFTSMFAAENACRVIERRGHKLVLGLVGDSLLEPFWPTGSGCARGFLSAFDASWMMRLWSSGKLNTLEVLAERESIYRLLAQTTPENLNKDHSSYTLDPMSRYPTMNSRAVLPFQLRSLFDTDVPAHLEEASTQQKVNLDDLPKKRKRRDSMIHPDTLLTWCKKQVFLYDDISAENFTTSFKDGRVLCAIIHRYRPELIDYHSLKAENITHNNELGFNIMEREFGIPPVMTGAEMEECDVPDKLSMISYISQIYDVFRGEIPDFKYPKMDDGDIELENATSPARRSVPHVNILKNLTNQTTENKRKSLSGMRDKRIVSSMRSIWSPNDSTYSKDDGRITCKIMDEGATNLEKKAEMKKNKKRRSDRVTSPLDKAEKMKMRDFQKAKAEKTEEFSDKIKDLEAKFTGNSRAMDKKPKELLRSIGKIENTDWNMMALDKKMQEEKLRAEHHEREKVPKWGRENYEDKLHNMERRLRENGEDEETIAKYRDIDSSLKRLEIKLREGSTLSPGLRGQNKVAGLANKLSTALETKQPEKVILTRQPTRPVVPLPTSGSDLCHFCGNRVYLVERLSAEGKFFHRQCFKCDYCAANLRLGNYIYDREGHFGGKFFCVPHYGLSSRAPRGKRKDDTDSTKENIVPPPGKVPQTPKGQVMGVSGAAAAKPGGVAGMPAAILPSIITPPGVAKALAGDHRGTTPERVEFENSLVEQSDEDEYLSEDEWTDRNFGASANELDESDGDESEYSDLSDEEAEGDDLVYLEGEGKLTAAETRRLAESWQRRYSTDRLIDDDESDLDSDNFSEEYGAEGDESHTATEGEAEEEDDEEDAEALRLARELRREELNIKHAPLRKAETSDSGSETEIASDEESEESDTQIDTDSEFDEDNQQSGYPKGIPTIVIDESQDFNASHSPLPPKNIPAKENNNKSHRGDLPTVGHPRPEYIEQAVDLGKTKKTDDEIFNENKERGTEKSASLSNIHDYKGSKDDALARIEQIRRYMNNRNEPNTSNEIIIAKQRGMQLKRNFLVGENTNLPKKSVSTADIGTKFKSFMDKISETQSMLKPAAQPSAQMQAFMNTPLTKTPLSSPSSPQLPNRSISLPQEAVIKGEISVTSDTDKKSIKDVTPSFPLVVDVKLSSEDQTKAGSTTTSNTSSPVVTIKHPHEKSASNNRSATESEVSKSDTSLGDSSSSQNDSDYDNVPSVYKILPVQPSPPVIKISEENKNSELDRICSTETENDIVNESEEIFKQIQSLATKDEDMDEFGLTLNSSAGLENESVETINRELVNVNAPRSLELISNVDCGRINTVIDEGGISVIFANDNISEGNLGEYNNVNDSEGINEVFSQNLSDTEKVDESDANDSEVDELFNQLASDAISTTGTANETDQFSGIIDRLNSKEPVEKLVNESSNLRKYTVQDIAEEKLERSQHVKNELYSESHEPVINVKSDEGIKICKNEYIVSKENSISDIVNKDLLSKENDESEIIENLNNLESNKFSIIEEKKNEQNVKNINTPIESFIGIEKNIKEFSVDNLSSEDFNESSFDTSVNTVAEFNNIETKNSSTNTSNHTSEEDLVIKASLEINKSGNRISVTEEVLSTSPANSDLEVSVPGKSLATSSLSTSPANDNLIRDALEVPEYGKTLEASTLSSPESRAETMASESEFLDWEPDHDRISIGEDLDMELNPEINIDNFKDVKHKPIARIASIESLGDTNSEISAATPKSPKKSSTNVSSKLNPITSAKNAVLTDLDEIEFMDTSESGSSPEDAPHRRQGYRKLEEVTPTTPVAPSVEDFTKAAGDGKLKSSDQSLSSSSTNTSDDDDTKSSVQEATEKNNNLAKSIPPKNVIESNDNQVEDKVLRSNSEPPSLSEKIAKVNGTPRRDSLDDFATPKRYEGYIPRFKDRVSPFGFVRDSIDVVSKRNTTKTPLFTPSKQDIEERKQNENRLHQLTIESNKIKTSISPNTAKKKIVESLKKSDKDGDLVREMVMNRIPRKTHEKTSRRGSRTSSIGSRSSLLSPQSSQENLLDKKEKSLDLGKEKLVTESQNSTCKSNNELFSRSISESNGNNPIVNDISFRIPLEKKELRLDALKSSLSKSTDSFLIERNQKSLEVEINPAIDSSTRQNSCIIDSVPFADDSQDEVFEPAKEQNNKSVISSNAPVKPARKMSNSPQSVNGNESSLSRSALPATPLTHPEKFRVNDHSTRKELFKVPTTPASATPVHKTPVHKTPVNKTPLSTQLSTPNSVDRIKLREEARQRAQCKTDTDLGISPPNLADNLREKLRKGSFSENEEKQKSESEKDRKEKLVETPKRKDKEERVQELLAEHRQRDNSSPRDSNKKAKDWVEKDERVRERLEEYRQKRGSEAVNRNSGGVELRKNSAQLVRRHTHRPSLLELESMQVFTVAGHAPQKSASATCIPSSMANSYTTQPYISATPPKSLPGAMRSASTTSVGSTPPTGTPTQSKPEQDGSSEKKPVKKSKDRERRRSLIQVFTGMFSKSGNEERKKSIGDVTDGTEEKKTSLVTTGSSSTSGPSSPIPVIVNTSTPVKSSSLSRSPSTVKDKLSRLRLSRSKEKKKANSDKSRSTSADMLDGGSTSDDTRLGQSLPTSPTRRSFSPFSAFTKTNTPPQASEESLSESEDQSCNDRTPGGTLERGGQPPGSSSMARRSRAVQRAARQAELKRHRMAQEIQRKLEECEVKTRELEERGVNVEKSLRGENSGNTRDEAELMSDWFSMVHEKNALGRWEQELMVRAKELELEDRHVRLENELKHRMALSEHEKSREDIDREGHILAEMLSILEQKDALVNMLEEEKQRYIEEDRELEDIKQRKCINLTPSRRETGV